jgi:hypothetical protein
LQALTSRLCVLTKLAASSEICFHLNFLICALRFFVFKIIFMFLPVNPAAAAAFCCHFAWIRRCRRPLVANHSALHHKSQEVGFLDDKLCLQMNRTKKTRDIVQFLKNPHFGF